MFKQQKTNNNQYKHAFQYYYTSSFLEIDFGSLPLLKSTVMKIDILYVLRNHLRVLLDNNTN
jgi:hypothetical protein